MRPIKDRRVFFALWPDDQCRALLANAQKSLVLKGDKARYVPSRNLHVTLHFIGNVAEKEIPCLRQQAQNLDAGSFRVSLDRTGFFKKPRVAWLGCSRPPAELLHLQQELGDRLRECGFQPERRRYNPHLTMIRKQASEPPEMSRPAIQWTVSDFVLIDSVSVSEGVRYDVLERFPLK